MTARWDYIMPSAGKYDTRTLDTLVFHVESATARGLKVCLVLHGTPHWASTLGRAGDPGAAIATDSDAFSSFVGFLFERFGSRIAAWEVWNEPNSAQFWAQPTFESARAFAKLYDSAALELRSRGATSPVVLGGISRIDINFLLNALSTSSLIPDAIAIHPYTGGRHPRAWFGMAASDSAMFPLSQEGTRYWRNIATLRHVLDMRGYSTVPLWITEMGWDHRGPEGVPDVASHMQEAVSSLRNDVRGVRRIFWFSALDWSFPSTSSAPTESMGLADSQLVQRRAGDEWKRATELGARNGVMLTIRGSVTHTELLAFHGCQRRGMRWVPITDRQLHFEEQDANSLRISGGPFTSSELVITGE
jgi:hypothetical protein